MFCKKELQEFTKSIDILKCGSILLYPTETVWGIGCDATNETAIYKVYQIKHRRPQKAMIVLVDSPKMLKSLVRVPRETWKYIYEYTKPLTIIYDNHIYYRRCAKYGSIAVRLTKDPFCRVLIQSLGNPIVSTSANFSEMPTPLSYHKIHYDILKKVDYCVELRRKDQAIYSHSVIIQYHRNGFFKLLRK